MKLFYGMPYTLTAQILSSTKLSQVTFNHLLTQTIEFLHSIPFGAGTAISVPPVAFVQRELLESINNPSLELLASAFPVNKSMTN
ncbi:hypothetical protein CEXT_622931 [Caerostris extrusa]|uniref:Uncharacterized protein n=1 Tax=Caerostris extrusa TaxID=172846 RepID=A0AAV4PSH7_CAEEX|nr:hypothetical protein CEXT_622931 [Caerostris extrusa]